MAVERDPYREDGMGPRLGVRARIAVAAVVAVATAAAMVPARSAATTLRHGVGPSRCRCR
jgi:hypothetical protein